MENKHVTKRDLVLIILLPAISGFLYWLLYKIMNIKDYNIFEHNIVTISIFVITLISFMCTFLFYFHMFTNGEFP